MSFGLVLAAVFGSRILWRLTPNRRHFNDGPDLASRAAWLMHRLLYILIAVEIVLGVFTRWTDNQALSFFGFLIPSPFGLLNIVGGFFRLGLNRKGNASLRHFITTMMHPNGPEWENHLKAHVTYLKTLIESGCLVASGPLKHTDLRSGFLIFRAENRAAVEAFIAEHPFSKAALIETLEVIEWDPVFGAFSAWSSGIVPDVGAPYAATPAEAAAP